MTKILIVLSILTAFASSSYAITNKNIQLRSDLAKNMWNQGLRPIKTIDDQNYQKYLNYVDNFEEKFAQNDHKMSLELEKALNAIK